MLRPMNGKFCFVLYSGIFFFTLSCESPFAMRDPEPPVLEQSGWEPAHSPVQLITNFQKAIAERDLEKYERCFVDANFSEKQFLFVPDPGVFSSHIATFENWSLDNEIKTMRQAFQYVPDDSISQLTWEETIREIMAPDTAVLIRTFELKLGHTQTDLPRFYTGQISLRLLEDQRGEWVIFRWEDTQSVPEQKSWSFLKASLGG